VNSATRNSQRLNRYDYGHADNPVKTHPTPSPSDRNSCRSNFQIRLATSSFDKHFGRQKTISDVSRYSVKGKEYPGKSGWDINVLYFRQGWVRSEKAPAFVVAIGTTIRRTCAYRTATTPPTRTRIGTTITVFVACVLRLRGGSFVFNPDFLSFGNLGSLRYTSAD